jgi:hypothetical protein
LHPHYLYLSIALKGIYTGHPAILLLIPREKQQYYMYYSPDCKNSGVKPLRGRNEGQCGRYERECQRTCLTRDGRASTAGWKAPEERRGIDEDGEGQVP